MRTLVRKCEQHKTRNRALFTNVTVVLYKKNGEGMIFTQRIIWCFWSQKVVFLGLVKGLFS